MSGPAPKPTRLKRLQGNPGKRRLNDREPQPREGTPTRPEWLLPEAKREWTRLVRELRALRLLTLVDRGALASCCQWWARYVQAEQILYEEGLTFTTDKGYVQQRPEVAIAQKASDRYRAFLAQFGLTPASRSRLKMPPPDVKEDFAEALVRMAMEG